MCLCSLCVWVDLHDPLLSRRFETSRSTALLGSSWMPCGSTGGRLSPPPQSVATDLIYERRPLELLHAGPDGRGRLHLVVADGSDLRWDDLGSFPRDMAAIGPASVGNL